MGSLVDCFVVTGCNLGSRGDPLKCRQGLHVADVAAFPIQSVDIIQNKQPIHDVTDCTFLNKYYSSSSNFISNRIQAMKDKINV